MKVTRTREWWLEKAAREEGETIGAATASRRPSELDYQQREREEYENGLVPEREGGGDG